MQNDAKQGKWTPSGAKGCKRKLFSGKTVISLQKSQKITHFYLKKPFLQKNCPLYREPIFHYIGSFLLHRNPVSSKLSTISRVSTISLYTISRVDCNSYYKYICHLEAFLNHIVASSGYVLTSKYMYLVCTYTICTQKTEVHTLNIYKS